MQNWSTSYSLHSVKIQGARQDFVLDYVKLCTIADIPTERMRPFLRKYCAQAGALPQIDKLHSTSVPRVFEAHFTALKNILKGQSVSLTAAETTDIRDHSIVNVIATAVRGRPYLIDIVKMHACNHSTFSQAIIQAAIGAGIPFEQVIAIVSDSAAYCKKAYLMCCQLCFRSQHMFCA